MTEGAPLKRKRLGSKAPLETLSEAAEEADESSETKESSTLLVCELAQQALSKYSLGVMRIPLQELGVSPLNRDVSGSHVHDLGRRIISRFILSIPSILRFLVIPGSSGAF